MLRVPWSLLLFASPVGCLYGPLVPRRPLPRRTATAVRVHSEDRALTRARDRSHWSATRWGIRNGEREICYWSRICRRRAANRAAARARAVTRRRA